MSSSSVHIVSHGGYDNDTTMSDSEREAARIRDAYYAAYDVMTGVRIAATLGGFFGLMVILVVYKSKSKTEKALEDPQVQAVAIAEAEEEERQIAAALEQTVYEQLNPAGAAMMAAAAAATAAAARHASFSSGGSGSGRRIRHSLDTCHSSDRVAPGWIRQTKRFSSVGGYSSLLEPPIRIHKSAGIGGGMLCSSSIIDEDSPPLTLAEDGVDVERSCYDDVSTYFNGRNLYVPRRASNITCSSTGSAYLERRGSNILHFNPHGLAPMSISPRPSISSHHNTRRCRRQSSPAVTLAPFSSGAGRYQPYRLCAQSTICSDDGADANGAIDIRVIQPTPGGSPCGSERHLGEDGRVIVGGAEASVGGEGGGQVPQHRRLAPLASISSCNSSTLDATMTDSAPKPPPYCHHPRHARTTTSSSDYYYPDIDLLPTDTTDTDTVFRDMDCLCNDDDDLPNTADTDDEVDTFSTDSDIDDDAAAEAGSCGCLHQEQLQRLLLPPSPSAIHNQASFSRRYSARTTTPTCSLTTTTSTRDDFFAAFTSPCTTRMIDSSSSSTCPHCHQEMVVDVDVEMEMDDARGVGSPAHETTALIGSSSNRRGQGSRRSGRSAGYEKCPSCKSPLQDEASHWTQETLF